MARARKILKRAKAAKAIRTVTKTMEMVASARFKRVHEKEVSARPYTTRIGELVGELVAQVGEDLRHPLLEEREGPRRDVLLVLTSNRGLCGGFNSSVLRVALERGRQLLRSQYEVLLQVSGKRGLQHFRFHKTHLDKEYTQFEDVPDYAKVAQVADTLMEDFLSGRVSGLEVAYMQFLSVARQKPVIATILPLSNLHPPQAIAAGRTGRTAYEFIPSKDVLLGRLLPTTARLRLYQCFLDSAASEQVMRIAAMRSATDNADDMIHTLTVRYNRLRQGQITTELAEIMGGRMGLEDR